MGSSDDRLSQLILLALADESPQTTSEIKAETGADSNQLIHYRCKNKLIPAGHVARANEPQKGRATEYALTADGAQYVALMKRDLETPETDAEALEMAQDALEMARKAKKSADSTSGQFSALKQKTEETLEEATESAEYAREFKEKAKEEATREARSAIESKYVNYRHKIEKDFVQPWEEFKEEFYEVQEKQREIAERQEEILDRLDELESGNSETFATESDVAKVRSDVQSIQSNINKINPQGLDIAFKNLNSRVEIIEGKLNSRILKRLIPQKELESRWKEHR